MTEKITELQQFLKRNSQSALHLGPYQIANLLTITGSMLRDFLEQSQSKANYPENEKISEGDLTRLENIFRELGDNFFPMAHTTLPLRFLRISQSDSLHALKDLSRMTLRSTEQLSELLEHLSSRLREMDT